MGEWLANSGVPVRCIEYTPFAIGKKKFLSFSVAFDRAAESLYPLVLQSQAREPATFWHNIGRADDSWWAALKARGEISASWENQPGDAGERTLRKYVKDDRIVAYATAYGAVGWGIIENPNSYKLLPIGDPGDILPDHGHRHRLNITWKSCAPKIGDGVGSDKIRERFGIYHPVSTSVRIADQNGNDLIKILSRRWPAR
jgi:hypothetical protein